MGRVIKFRAWDEEHHRWLEPDKMVMAYEKVYADWRCFEDGVEATTTLEQYTGLLDKNGKEIYEGDIVQTPYYIFEKEIGKEKHTVVYKEGCFGIERGRRYVCLSDLNVPTKYEYVCNVGEVPIEFEHPYEIIGNAHEGECKK